MKIIFACILIVIALYLVLDQQGAISWVTNQVNTGKAGATIRGLK